MEDCTKPDFGITYEIHRKIEEDEENFIYTSIAPYCDSITEKKLSKEELKRILLQGMKKGHWINEGAYMICSCCGDQIIAFKDTMHAPQEYPTYCPACGSMNRPERREDGRNT